MQDAVTFSSIPRDALDSVVLRPLDWPFAAATCRALRDLVQRQRAEWWLRRVRRPFTVKAWVRMQQFAIFCFLERWGETAITELRLRKNVDKAWKRRVLQALDELVGAATDECYTIDYTVGAGEDRPLIAELIHTIKRDDVIYALYDNPFDLTTRCLFSNFSTAVGYAQRALLPCDLFMYRHGKMGNALLHFHKACYMILH